MAKRKRSDSLYMRDYYKANRPKWKRSRAAQDKVNARRRELYRLHESVREAAKAEVKKWQQANPEKRLAQRLRQYGLTPDGYRAMLVSHAGRCAICGFEERAGNHRTSKLHIDHCHATATVRGLLCHQCNMGIGKFGDDPARLEAAAMYLRASIRPEGAGQ